MKINRICPMTLVIALLLMNLVYAGSKSDKTMNIEDSFKVKYKEIIDKKGRERAFINATKDKDVEMRLYALRSLNLARNKNQDIVAAIIELSRDEAREISNEAIVALGDIKTKEAVNALIENTKNENINISKAAINRLGEIGSEEAIPELVKALKHKNIDVRYYAAFSLQRLGNNEGIPILVEASTTRDDFDRYVTIRALGEIGTKEVIPALIKAAKDPNASCRFEAIHALRMMGCVEAIPLMIKIVRDQEPSIKSEAIEFLSAIEYAKIKPIFLKLLDDPDRNVREIVMWKFARSKDESMVSSLGKGLTDERIEVQKAASYGLCEINNKESSSILVKAVKDENINTSIKLDIINELFNRRNSIDCDLTELLIGLMNDKNDAVRIESIKELWQIGDAKAGDAFKKALKDKNREIRIYAIKGLGKIVDKSAIPELQEIIKNSDDAEAAEWAKKAVEIIESR